MSHRSEFRKYLIRMFRLCGRANRGERGAARILRQWADNMAELPETEPPELRDIQALEWAEVTLD